MCCSNARRMLCPPAVRTLKLSRSTKCNHREGHRGASARPAAGHTAPPQPRAHTDKARREWGGGGAASLRPLARAVAAPAPDPSALLELLELVLELDLLGLEPPVLRLGLVPRVLLAQRLRVRPGAGGRPSRLALLLLHRVLLLPWRTSRQ